MEMIIEMFSYPFMVRAFTVGALVALCSALLGVSLVLKRYSMIGDGLSHVGFGALAIAASLNDQRRCGDRADLYQFACGGRDGDLHDDRDEYGCV